MTDNKTYATREEAVAAFRALCPNNTMSDEEIADGGYVDEDEPGRWVVNTPEDCVAEDEFEAGMAAERAQREAAKLVAEGHINESQHPMLAGRKPVPAAVVAHDTELPKSGRDGKCPHCGVNTWEGDRVTEYAELSPGSQRNTNQQFTCNECAGEWGPAVDKPKSARAPSGTSNGLKIEKDRETRNGVSRPSAGGKCRAVWDMLDDIGPDATAKQAREGAQAKGFDKTTTMVQFYRWRKFNGVSGK